MYINTKDYFIIAFELIYYKKYKNIIIPFFVYNLYIYQIKKIYMFYYLFDIIEYF